MGIIIFVLMKAAILALIAASVSATRITDGPSYFNEPTWTEKMLSAGGFVQISACLNSEHSGVTCSPPRDQLFATGMNGDEDLGEDIIMKGKPFHYNQRLLPRSLMLQFKTRPRKFPFSRPQSPEDTLLSTPRRTEHSLLANDQLNKELELDHALSDHLT